MSHSNSRKTIEYIKDFVERNEGYTLLSKEYKNAKSHIEIEHVCGNIFNMTYDHFHRGYRCPKCSLKKRSMNRRLSPTKVRQDIERVAGDDYILLSKYEKHDIKLKFKHISCGSIFEMEYRAFYHYGQRCPICIISKGERIIKEWLIENNMEFEEEYRIEECIYKRPLPFDFKVGDVLIEYDGEQHFNEDSFMQGAEGLKEVQLRDSIKTNFCKENNIPLLRIPYTEIKNINKILKNYFNI